MNNSPSVSILVPVYGVESYIERCARSLFEQTYENLEYIFVDDCTQDRSIQVLLQVMDDYPHRKPHVNIVHHQSNRGISAARNTAVEHAETDFLIYVDPDDWIECNTVELLVKRQLETGADIVTPKPYVYLDGKVLTDWDEGDQYNRETTISKILGRSICHHLWCRLIRTSLYKENNVRCIEGVNVGEDLQTVVPLLYYSNKVAGVDTFLYHYRSDNAVSYMRRIGQEDSLRDQMVSSVASLVSFFKTRDQEYFISANHLLMQHKYDTMVAASNEGNKHRFDYYAKQLKEQPQYWSAIRWNNSLIRTIQSNYFLYRTIAPSAHKLLSLHRLMKKLASFKFLQYKR